MKGRSSHLRIPAVLTCAVIGVGCAEGTGDGPGEVFVEESVRVSAGAYDFALVGDNPYQPEDIPKFEALIDDVNAQPSLEWVLHVGDISGRPCSDELYRNRFDLYQRFELPFVFTPGDNDWFDCVRDFQGSYDDYERLGHLRSVFFPDPSRTTGGRTMPVRSQSDDPGYPEFVENAIWTRGGVVFATVHLVALSREPTRPDLATRRMDAAVAWITEAFDLARDRGSAGVFIATQVDPWIITGNPALVRRACASCQTPRADLLPLYSVLIEQTTRFPGPVVLAVGDTHIFRVDKPLYREDGSLVENFTRVEAFGNPMAHWVRVRVDPSERQVFTFIQELVPGNVEAGSR